MRPTPAAQPRLEAGVLAVRRELSRQFREAERRARCHGRLRRADIYGIINRGYAAARGWDRADLAQEAEEILRATALVPITTRSSLYLVLLRSALPGLDPKRASKWAAAMEVADREELSAKQFRRFLDEQGGVEGAARTRARRGRADEDQAS